MSTLRTHATRRGPSRYLVAVLRELLHGNDTVPALTTATGLDERTVRAQITHLRANQAIRKVDHLPLHRRGGVLAIYKPVIVEVT